MGNSASLSPQSEEEILTLKSKVKESAIEAAHEILNADIFLLATGAGFSADSGLAVYKDIADVPAYHERDLEYVDICQTSWLEKDPELFYGFWGSCFNDYRDTAPHEGYSIIKSWKSNLFESSPQAMQFKELWKQKYGEQSSIGPFFVYTSNVDHHFIKSGYDEKEVHEIHGSTEHWQCRFPCKEDIWKAPSDFRFIVNKQTMLAHPHAKVDKEGSFGPNVSLAHKLEDIDLKINECNGFISNNPVCKHCGELARPSVLMFGDMEWLSNLEQIEQESRWHEITRLLEQHQRFRLVILEIGCGINVRTVRFHTESLLQSFPNSILIRINPDYPYCGIKELQPKTISILEKGLVTVKLIDQYIREFKKQKDEGKYVPMIRQSVPSITQQPFFMVQDDHIEVDSEKSFEEEQENNDEIEQFIGDINSVENENNENSETEQNPDQNNLGIF